MQRFRDVGRKLLEDDDTMTTLKDIGAQLKLVDERDLPLISRVIEAFIEPEGAAEAPADDGDFADDGFGTDDGFEAPAAPARGRGGRAAPIADDGFGDDGFESPAAPARGRGGRAAPAHNDGFGDDDYTEAPAAPARGRGGRAEPADFDDDGFAEPAQQRRSGGRGAARPAPAPAPRGGGQQRRGR